MEAESEMEKLQLRIQQLEKELDEVAGKGKLIAQELDLFRQRRLIFWSDRFRNTFDAWNSMSAAFQQLKDDSAIFHGSIKKYRLQPSISLLRVPFLRYTFKLNKPGLCGILLAPVVDVPLHLGELSIRIFAPDDELLASNTVPMSQIHDDRPVLFQFDPIIQSDKTPLIMRVFVQGVDAPVRIFELRRYAFAGFGRLRTHPFAGFIFAGNS